MKYSVIRGLLLSVLIVFTAACQGRSGATIGGKYLADTPENRRQVAVEYLKVAPMKDLMNDVADKMAQQIPADKREDFLQVMKSGIDVSVLEKAAQESMVKHFTVAEIEALRNFYSSTEGRSAMKKMGDYMADLMPTIRQQVVTAMSKLQPQGGAQPEAQASAAPK